MIKEYKYLRSAGFDPISAMLGANLKGGIVKRSMRMEQLTAGEKLQLLEIGDKFFSIQPCGNFNHAAKRLGIKLKSHRLKTTKLTRYERIQ